MVNLANIHRIPVVDEHQKLIAVLSQTQVVHYLTPYVHLLPFANKTVEELELGNRKVVCVSTSDKVKDAFVKINSLKISGVAVLNSDGKLVGNISASDIKLIGLDASLFAKMELPISSVIFKINTKTTPVSVTPQSTIAQVFNMFNVEKLHRIYIREKGELLGVISVIDLINLVDRYC